MQTQSAETRNGHFKSGTSYVSHSQDLAKILKGEEGTFEAVFNGQSFLVNCQPGHSIESLIPNGTKNVWLITRQDQTAIQDSTDESSSASARAERSLAATR